MNRRLAVLVTSLVCVPLWVSAGEVPQRHSPFVPMNSIQVYGEGYQPEQNRQKQILERFDLSSLHYVGVIRQQDKKWGLVQDEAGKIHTIQVGSYLGKHEGKVIAIYKDKMTLEQWLPQSRGQFRKDQVEMSLK